MPPFRLGQTTTPIAHYLISNKGFETGPPVYSPYPKRLESLTICGCYTEAALSPQLF